MHLFCDYRVICLCFYAGNCKNIFKNVGTKNGFACNHSAVTNDAFAFDIGSRCNNHGDSSRDVFNVQIGLQNGGEVPQTSQSLCVTGLNLLSHNPSIRIIDLGD